MRTPRKLYLIVSRKLKRDASMTDLYFSSNAANIEAGSRNRAKRAGVDDWRVETFVKGD